jgi:hypothetical protein
MTFSQKSDVKKHLVHPLRGLISFRRWRMGDRNVSWREVMSNSEQNSGQSRNILVSD